MKRADLETSVCPVARTMKLVGDCWSLLIVHDVARGMHRFSELQKSLGLAKNILAARLRTMVDAEILELRPASDGSTYQEYILTKKGKDLIPVLKAISAWGAAHTDGEKSQPL